MNENLNSSNKKLKTNLKGEDSLQQIKLNREVKAPYQSTLKGTAMKSVKSHMGSEEKLSAAATDPKYKLDPNAKSTMADQD